jgi:hypothetical protein
MLEAFSPSERWGVDPKYIAFSVPKELGIKCHEVIPIPFKNGGFKSYPRDKREFIPHDHL